MKSTIDSRIQRMSAVPKQLTFYLFILGLSVVVVAETVDLSSDNRLLPLFFVSFLIVMTVLKLCFILYDRFYGLPPSITENSASFLEEFLEDNADVSTVRQLRMVLWIIGATTLVYLFGHLVAIPVFIFLFVFLESEVPLWQNVALSIGMMAAIYLIFVQLLSMRMYDGVIVLVPFAL